MTSLTPDLLRMKDVLALLRVSEPTLWHWRRAGRFPQPLRIGPNSVRWRRETVEAWLREREGAPR
jgi:prophage regulatory protein